MKSYEEKIIEALGVNRKSKKKGSKNRQDLSINEICAAIGASRKTKKSAVISALTSLKKQGKVSEENCRYFLINTKNHVMGTVVKVPSTFGFVEPTNGDKDIFVPGSKLLGAMPGDTVLVRIKDGDPNPEGEIISIINAPDRRFSGIISQDSNGGWLILPDSYTRYHLRVSSKLRMGSEPGEKVLARLVHRGSSHDDHRVGVVERLGDAESAAVCCRAILASAEIDTQFPESVLAQAKTAAEAGIHPKEILAREDLRDQIIFTIDGEDSKDLDDAINLKRLDSGWELGVHIADVSHYVPHKSALDEDAFLRGTSVYYADSVVPMLPPELSNGICSLNPGEDRLAFSAIIRLDNQGSILEYRFAKTVINSRIKGIYREINAILDNSADEAIRSKYTSFTDMLKEMAKLAAILQNLRFARGGMNLDTVESKILIGEDGRACGVYPRSRGVSEGMIEEFMLTANQAAARFAGDKGLPFIFRTHDKPSPDRIRSLYDMAERMGIIPRRPDGEVTSAKITALLDKASKTPASPMVSSFVLRAMAKAKYSPRPLGHFGLALADYTHFTSPIRRYPDLVIHRIMSAYVTRMNGENIQKRFSNFVAEASIHSSDREIAAMSAERQCVSCYKAEYMRRFIGDEFDGTVSSVTTFGVYVSLPSTVEGLISASELPDGDWQFDGLTLKDQVTGRKFQLGDCVRVIVLAARVSAGQVDFGLCE